MFSKTVLGENIRALRLKDRLTQQQLALIFDCTAQKIDDVENGKDVLSIEQAYILSILFDVSLEHLVYGGTPK
jgi:transcriptional regulator with XRE-family HTH domain